MRIFALLGILCLTRMTKANHCITTGTKKNKMVDLDNAGDGVVVALLGSRTLMTSSDCINTCCHTEDCDVAVFDSRNDSDTDTNCHMYTCEGCELKKQSSFTSYFISDENDVETTTENSINSYASSRRTSSTSSPMTSENNNSSEFEKIVLNKPTNTIIATDTIPESEKSVKGNLQESEIDIPLVIPDFASKLDDSQMIKSGSSGTDRLTETSSPNVNSGTSISPVVPGSKTSGASSGTSGTQTSDSESNSSTKTTDDSPSGQSNTDASPTSDNTPSEKTSTGPTVNAADTPTDKSSSDSAPPSDSTQTDSSSGSSSTVSNGDSSVSNANPDTAATSAKTQTETSKDKSTTNTNTDVAVLSTETKSPPPSGATQIDSSQGTPISDSSANSAVSDTAPSSDTSPPTDATQLDTPPGNPTSSDSNLPSSKTGGGTPPQKSTSENVPNTAADNPTTQTKVTSLSDNSKTGDSTTSDHDAGSINPPSSQTDNSETPKATSNPATTAYQPSVADVPEGLSSVDVTGNTAKQTDQTGNQASTDSGSKAEEADTQQDLPDNYNAPFVNHPTMVATALIAALSFGVIFFFAVTAIVGKRCYDGWQRRHYSRVDYLINGIYN